MQDLVHISSYAGCAPRQGCAGHKPVVPGDCFELHEQQVLRGAVCALRGGPEQLPAQTNGQGPAVHSDAPGTRPTT